MIELFSLQRYQVLQLAHGKFEIAVVDLHKYNAGQNKPVTSASSRENITGLFCQKGILHKSLEIPTHKQDLACKSINPSKMSKEHISFRENLW